MSRSTHEKFALTLSYPRYSDGTKKKDITVWGYRNVWFRFEPHVSRKRNPRMPQNPGEEGDGWEGDATSYPIFGGHDL